MSWQPPLPVQFTLNNRIRLHPYSVHREAGRDPLLQCTFAKNPIEVAEVTVQAMQAVDESPSIQAAQTRLAHELGEEPEVIELVRFLHQRGFVQTIDDTNLETPQLPEERHPLLHKLGQLNWQWLRAPSMLLLVLSSAALWVYSLVLYPQAIPNVYDLFLSERPAFNMVATFAGFLVMAYLHELAHYFMAKSYGLNPTISVSHRFYVLVLQTDVSQAWSLPRRQRTAIFLAGMGLNLVVASILGIIVAGAYAGMYVLPAGVLEFLRFAVYVNVFPLLFQLFLPARTDIYHVVMAYSGQRNLLNDSMNFFFHRLRRPFLPKQDECKKCQTKFRMDDPFCFTCRTERALPPNAYVHARSRDERSLLAYGAAFFAGSLLVYVYLFQVSAKYLLLNLTASTDYLAAAIAAPSFGAILEGEWAFIISLLQVVLVAYFIVTGLLGLLLIISGPAGRLAQAKVLLFVLRSLAMTAKRLPKRPGRIVYNSLLVPLARALGDPTVQAKPEGSK